KISPPNSLLIAMVDGGGGASLTKKFARSKGFCCQFSTRNSSDLMTLVRMTGMDSNYAVRVELGSGSFYVSESAPGANGIVGTIPYTANQWRFVVVRLSLPQGPGKGSIAVFTDDAGAPSLSASLGSATDDLGFDTLEVGMSGAANVARTLRYDDV